VKARRAPLFAAGILIAAVGAVCGIGGGLFTVPLLHFVHKLELKRAVATALVLVVTTTGFATLGECLRDAPELHLEIVWRVALGALLGAQAGFFVAGRIRTDVLRMVFVVVLLGAAWRMAWSGGGAAEALDASQWLGTAARWKAFFAGVGGGFVSPLLGVGGGLLMVPALFLGIPGMGFGEARATSLAAGFVAALRALWLHGRAGRVEFAAVAPLAVGAACGALAGVTVVHLEGVVHVGRLLLAGVLAFVALRFARDLVQARAEKTA
jgi:hypothetical protein